MAGDPRRRCGGVDGDELWGLSELTSSALEFDPDLSFGLVLASRGDRVLSRLVADAIERYAPRAGGLRVVDLFRMSRVTEAFLAHCSEDLPDDQAWEAWAYSAVSTVVDLEQELGWELVRALVARADDEVLGVVAAGPLEDLLRVHAAVLVDRVETGAPRSITRASLRSPGPGGWLTCRTT